MISNKMHLLAAVALSTAMAPSAMAQDPTATTGALASSDVGVSPTTGLSASDYVNAITDVDLYEIQSSKLALRKTKDASVKAFASRALGSHAQSSQSVQAALSNADRKLTKPSPKLSTSAAAKVELLSKAPKASFDALYMQQQMQAQQTAWSIHKGYVLDGNDPALKQVASTSLPVVERQIVSLRRYAARPM